MLSSSLLGVFVYRLSANMIESSTHAFALSGIFYLYEMVLNVLLIFVWVCCLYYFVTMLCQHWVVGVVWNVLRTTYCLYVSLFLLVQGSAFEFLCMYAPSHPVKK